MPQSEMHCTSPCLVCSVLCITRSCSSPRSYRRDFRHGQPSAGGPSGSFYNSAILLSEVLVRKGLEVAFVLSHESPPSTAVTWGTSTCSPQAVHQQLVCPSFVGAPDSQHTHLHISFCGVSPGFTLRPVQTQRTWGDVRSQTLESSFILGLAHFVPRSPSNSGLCQQH